MTDKNTTEYLERLKSVSMPSSVKARMRDELSSYADFHAPAAATSTKTSFGPNYFFDLLSRNMGVALVVLLLIGTGSVSLFADRLLTGGVPQSPAVDGPDADTLDAVAPMYMEIESPSAEPSAAPALMYSKSTEAGSADTKMVPRMQSAEQLPLLIRIQDAEDRIARAKSALAQSSALSGEDKAEYVARLDSAAKLIADAHALAANGSQSIETQEHAESLLEQGLTLTILVEDSTGI